MKKLLLSLVLFAISLSAAKTQIALEHVYPFPNISRALIPGAGERYYALTIDSVAHTGTIHWFDGNHAPLSNTTFALPPGIFNVFIIHRSTDFFDNDPGIEFSIRWINATFNPRNQIFDDDGTALSCDLPGLLSFFTVDGVNKVLTGYEVYAVPGFSIEHSFSNVLAKSTELEGEGIKFWYLEPFSGDVVMLNDDYSLYKTFALDADIISGCPYNLFCYNKLEANEDDKVEWVFQTSCSGQIVYRFYSDSDLIFERTGSVPGSGLYPNTVLPGYGLDTPKTWFIFFGNGMIDSVEVYDIFSNTLEHVFTGAWSFTNDWQGNILYFMNSVPSTQDAFQVLNKDYDTWATFPNYTASNLNLLGFSTDIFDNDPSTKEVFSYFNGPGGTGHAVWRSDGTVLLELVHSFNSAYVSSLYGLPNKLIFTSPTTPATVIESHVYSIPSSTAVAVEEAEKPEVLHFSVSPNPFSGALRLDFSDWKEPVTEVRVTDLTGRLVFHTRPAAGSKILDLTVAAQWPEGVYFVHARSLKNAGTQKVIRQ
ncbi:MAG: T9SS type A sorting domain-containing protein [Bacteroidetes bacterium]|nr:T9SS type A sorting domain-containing protein [Bacteroidota bacterium]